MQGMVAMNAWGFFANLSYLSQDVLSFLSSVVSQLQSALATHVESTTIANVTFDLPHLPIRQDVITRPFALMFSGPSDPRTTGAHAVRQVTDEFFATHSRRVVLIAAPVSLMVEAVLRCADAVRAPVPAYMFLIAVTGPTDRPPNIEPRNQM